MNTPEKCPKCGIDMTVECDGRPMHVGREWRMDEYAFCLERQRDQLAARVQELQLSYSEMATTLHLTQNREHDLKRVLDDIRIRRDQTSADLATHRDANEALVERVRELEAEISRWAAAYRDLGTYKPTTTTP